MLRLHSIRALALLALAGGCASARPHGTLSPVGTRVTNEVLSEDGLTFDDWARRVAAVQRAQGPSVEARAYAAARAAAWLTYARESYAWDPRDGVADAALGETRRIVVALERDTVPELSTLPVALDVRARPDLWTALERARLGGALAQSPEAVAGAEVALVRASRLAATLPADAVVSRPMTAFERACELELQVATAERLLAGIAPAAQVTAAPVPAEDVALAGDAPAQSLTALPAPSLTLPSPMAAPTPVRPVARTELPALARRPLQRVVHFALNSSELALQSRLTLGEVIAMLRSHPKVNLVIEGYTDPRGADRLNRELAMRRAVAVHRFLDGASLDLGRVTVAAPRVAARARAGSVEAFARARRVTLTFTGANGAPLTLAAYEALDLDNERDLQVEQERRIPARAARASAGDAGRSSATPR